MNLFGATGEIGQSVLGDDEFGDEIHDRVDLRLINAEHALDSPAFRQRLGRGRLLGHERRRFAGGDWRGQMIFANRRRSGSPTLN